MNKKISFIVVEQWHGTTILSLCDNNEVVLIGDGQVSMGHTVIKSTARKLRSLKNGSVLVGFAGSTADAFALLDRLEKKLDAYGTTGVQRACVALAQDWRSDRFLRRLEAMMIVVTKEHTLIINGAGDVLEPENRVAAIGSGGHYALCAAKAFLSVGDEHKLSAEEMARRSMHIAANICVYTNTEFSIEKLSLAPEVQP